jgi:outer membrane protein TolC
MTSFRTTTIVKSWLVLHLTGIAQGWRSKYVKPLSSFLLSIAVIPGFCQSSGSGASLEPAAGLSRASESLLQQSQSDQQGSAFPELLQLLQRAFMQSPVPLKAERNVAAGQARIEEANAAFLPRLSTSLGAGRTDYGANASSNGQGDRSMTASQLVYDFGLSTLLSFSELERIEV